jgi:hypothetical protein
MKGCTRIGAGTYVRPEMTGARKPRLHGIPSAEIPYNNGEMC